jgi:hypothetical protein
MYTTELMAMKTLCQMNLRNFPFDTQLCNIEIESWCHIFPCLLEEHYILPTHLSRLHNMAWLDITHRKINGGLLRKTVTSQQYEMSDGGAKDVIAFLGTPSGDYERVVAIHTERPPD